MIVRSSMYRNKQRDCAGFVVYFDAEGRADIPLFLYELLLRVDPTLYRVMDESSTVEDLLDNDVDTEEDAGDSSGSSDKENGVVDELEDIEDNVEDLDVLVDLEFDSELLEEDEELEEDVEDEIEEEDNDEDIDVEDDDEDSSTVEDLEDEVELSEESELQINATATALALLQQHNIDASLIQGTGVDGRIVARDVRKYIEQHL